MQRVVANLFLIAIFLPMTAGTSFSQASSPPIHRDAHAVTVVQNALAYLNNNSGTQPANAVTIQDSTVQGTCVSQETDSTTPTTTSIAWTAQGAQFRYDTTVSGQVNSFRSGHGAPMVMSSDGNSPLSPYTALASLPYHMPAQVLSSDLANAQYAFFYRGVTNTSQGSADTVEVILFAGGAAPMQLTRQVWKFLIGSGQPLEADYRIPGEDVPTVQMAMTLSYTGFALSSSGSIFPTGFTITSPIDTATCTVSSTAINTSPASSVFDAEAQ